MAYISIARNLSCGCTAELPGADIRCRRPRAKGGLRERTHREFGGIAVSSPAGSGSEEKYSGF